MSSVVRSGHFRGRIHEVQRCRLQLSASSGALKSLGFRMGFVPFNALSFRSAPEGSDGIV